MIVIDQDDGSEPDNEGYSEFDFSSYDDYVQTSIIIEKAVARYYRTMYVPSHMLYATTMGVVLVGSVWMSLGAKGLAEGQVGSRSSFTTTSIMVCWSVGKN